MVLSWELLTNEMVCYISTMDEEKTTRDARKGSFQWDMYRIGVVAIWGAAIYLLFFYSFPWGDAYDWNMFEAWEHARQRGEPF